MAFHHFLSKTYLRSWGYSKKAVWTYNKSANIAEPKKLKCLIGQENYHRINAGSLFITPEIADHMFACLNNLSVEYRGERITANLELNECFPYFHNWIIRTCDNQIIDENRKQEICNEVKAKFDDSIERDWDRQYENWWPIYIKRIFAILESYRNNSKVPLDFKDIDFMFRCYIMYDWRCQSESNSVSLAFDLVETYAEPLTKIRIPPEFRYNEYDDTLLDEIKHAYYLREYYNFLHGSGQMYDQLNLYEQNFALLFLISGKERFITCESPVFWINGKEPVFIALPKLIISVMKKDTRNPQRYYYRFLSDDEVMFYNKAIFLHGKTIIGFDENFSKYQ